MFEQGASCLLEEKDLNVDNTITLIDSLINDDEKLQKMSDAAKKMSHPNAALDMVKEIKRLVGKN